MKNHAKFQEVSLRAIEPEGWLRVYLENQARGLTGHMEAAGHPFDTAGWASHTLIDEGKRGWVPYEQTAYWTDGAIRLAHLLKDERLLKKALKGVEFTLRHPDADGYLGHPLMKPPKPYNRWPHAVFFRALMAHFGVTGDRRILEALRRHYLNGTSEHCLERDICNVEAMLWTYEQTGDRQLLKHALDAFDKHNRLHPDTDTCLTNLLSGKRATAHGVSFHELGKLGAVVYLHTGTRRFLEAAVNGYGKLDRDQMLVDGVPSSAEMLQGKDPLDSHETCDIADYTWGAGYLLMATGDARWADKIERACFNAAPGAVTPDFRALQYFSCPNQVVAAHNSNHNEFFRGDKWMSYRPNPGTECCPGDVNRIMPNFAARMWMTTPDGSPAAVLYGPSRMVFRSGSTDVTITEETTYPFSAGIRFSFQMARAVSFPFTLRIPGWCRQPRLLLNGAPVALKLKPGTFVTLRRKFASGDQLTLQLPMELKLSHWPRGGVAVERGPLVYALQIKEDWQRDPQEKRQTRDFPAWNMQPGSPWNYALCLDEKLLKEAEVICRDVTGNPWQQEHAPILIRVPARRVRNWKLERKTSVRCYGIINKEEELGIFMRKGDFVFTPQLPDPKTLPKRLAKKLETITLIPYGCTRLRISVFPQGR